jgi:hypothetical protein
VSKGLSPVQRTMRALRERGAICAVVEKWNAYGGPHGIRQDLFGIIDIIVLDPSRGVVGVQACGSDFKAHLDKLLTERHQETSDWLMTPGTHLELWGWRKIHARRGGKAMVWRPRVLEVTVSHLLQREGISDE